MIEEDIRFLMEAVQALHNPHKWVRGEAFEMSSHGKRKEWSCGATCKCGADKVVTKAEYDALPPSYNAEW